MGPQQGLDVVEDTELRRGHTLPNPGQWTATLADAGFSRTPLLDPDGGPGSVGFDVLVAEGPAQVRRFVAQRLR